MLNIEERRRKTLIAAVLISAAVHLLVFGTLIYQRVVKTSAQRGLIDVQFIEPVQHSATVDGDQKISEKKQPEAQPSTTAATSAQVKDPAEASRLTNAYIQQVLQLLNRKKTYPKEALQREQEGKVMVAVTVDMDGRILETLIEEPSPFNSLNTAAVDTINAVGKFPPLPFGIEAPLHLHIPLVFKLDSR